MELTVVHDQDITIITPEVDRLDAQVALEFKTHLHDIIAHGARRIVVNLRHVSFLDSTGLGALVSGLKKLDGQGALVVCHLNPTVKTLFEVTRMHRVFQVFDTEALALEGLRP